MTSRLRILFHVAGGISFLLIPVLIAPQPAHFSRFVLDGPTQRDFLGNFLMLGFFYLNYFFLLPKYFFQKKYFHYGTLLALVFCLVIFVPEFVTQPPPFERNPGPLPGHFQTFPPQNNVLDLIGKFNHQILLFLAVVLFSILLRLREQLLLTEQANLSSELNALKSQVNPHFLFNTLNSIYALSLREKAELTGTSILKLSGLMRYSAAQATMDNVPLALEIDNLNNYLELQRLRLADHVKLEFSLLGNSEGMSIAPMILVPFVENAFKHGVNPDLESEIKIQLRIDEKKLEFRVENKLVPVILDSFEENGSGLENTRKRLSLIYGKDHDLQIKKTETHFKVLLFLNIR